MLSPFIHDVYIHNNQKNEKEEEDSGTPVFMTQFWLLAFSGGPIVRAQGAIARISRHGDVFVIRDRFN